MAENSTPSGDEPDFQSLGLAWVDGDPRSADLHQHNPELRERIARRIAEALEQRRAQAERPIDDADSLIVTVPEERFTEQGLDGGALAQLEEFVREHIEKLPDLKDR